MEVKYLNLISQYETIKDEVEKEVLKVLRSGRYCLGEQVASFENNFANYCNVKYAVACNSGTSALHMALLAAGIKEGDEVITTACTFVATVAAILLVKATPVIVDISPDTLNITAKTIEKNISSRTKAVIAVHLHGNPCEMDEIKDLCRNYNLVLIEDAAQAHGSEFQGKRIGSIGDMACFSFYPGKNLGACGEAGAVTTNDSKYAEKLKLIRDWGSEKKYEYSCEGYNYRMDAIQGAILDVKLKKLPEWTERRIEKSRFYKDVLASQPVLITSTHREAKHVYHVFAIRTEKRDSLKNYLAQYGIETGIHYPVPVHQQPAFSKKCKFSDDMSVSEKAAQQLLSLPIYPELNSEGIIYISDMIKRFFKGGY